MILQRQLPLAVTAALTAVLMPVLVMKFFRGGLRVELFLPMLVYAAAGGGLAAAIVWSWILGALTEVTGFLPAGVGVLSFQLLAFAIMFSSRWLTLKNPLGFALFCFPAALLNELVSYLVMSICGYRVLFYGWAVLSTAIFTAIWAAAVHYAVNFAWKAMGARLSGSPTGSLR
ncbi:MAG: hypothetical protein WC889_12255 [Myxococcota bacterium]|jgi:cell shape-determining protein MreD